MQRVPSNGTHNLPSPAASSSSHKRTLSTLNRPSPTNGTWTGAGMSPASISAIAAESPERASKRARFDASAAAAAGASGNANANGSNQQAGNGSGVKLENKGRGDTVKEGGGEGVRWVLERVKIMEKQYKDAVLAAALVMQHRAYSRKIGIRSKNVPLHLTQRLEHAWASYEATRRHVGAYMLACAQHAVTPSRPMPSTLPPPPIIASGPSGLTPAPLAGASPVGLGASSLLAFESDAEKLASSLASTKPPDLAGLEARVFPNGTETAMGNGTGTGTGTGTMPTQDNALAALGGLGGVDLSSLGMAELTAIINGENFDFAAAANPNPVTGEMTTTGNGNGNGGPSAADIGAMLASANAAAGAGAGAGGPIGGVSNTQAETERLLAQLGGLPIPDTIDNPNVNASNLGNQSSVPASMGQGQTNIGLGVGAGSGSGAGPSTATQQASQQQPAQPSMSDQLGGELNVDDMLASLGGADGGFDFDFGGGMEGLGDLDLGNLSELAGLFEVTGDGASGEQAGGLMEMGQGQNQGQGQGQGEAVGQQEQPPQQQQPQQQQQSQQQQQPQQQTTQSQQQQQQTQQQQQQQQQQRPQQQQHGIGVGRGSQSAASGEQSQPAASTQTQQPSSAAQQTQPESQSHQAPQAAQPSTQPPLQEPSSQPAPPPVPSVIPAQASASASGLEGIMPSLTDTNQPQSGNPTAQTGEIDLTADFDMQNMGGYGLGGIDMDDFDFGDGAMPVVNEDDFESLFAEFD